MRFLLTIILVFCCSIGYSQSGVQQFVDHPALKHASVGISVVDLNTNKSIVSYNSEKSLTPASVLKLVTTATAIETFGDNWRYKTDVLLDAEDPTRILVRGAGDPSLSSEAFKENPYSFFVNSAQLIKKSVPHNRQYSIYVIDNLFGYDGVSPEWTWIDMGNYYAAGAYGISVFDNSYKLYFDTSNKNSCPKILRTEPNIKGLTFQNELTLNYTGRDNGYIYGAPFSFDRSIRGNIPAGRVSFSIKGDIPDPGLMLGETLAEYLQKEGIAVTGVETARNDYISQQCNFESKTEPYKFGELIFTQLSRPLKELIREINVVSNNHYAEHLIRTLGRNADSDIYESALGAGVEYIGEFWKRKSVDIASLQIYDGSGLAPQNAVSSEFLTELLIYMFNDSKYSDAFIYSLPKAGQEGTLSSFMRNTKYRGKIYAKSGSIGGVQCFAGYILDGDKKLAFTVMVNKFNGTRAHVRGAIEQFLLSL